MEKKEYSFTKNKIIIGLVITVVVIAGLWIWKSLEVASVRKEYDAREQKLVEKVNVEMAETTKRFLKLIAKPYVWAIRTEMMKGNINQVNLYGNDIISEKNIVSIMVVNDKGVVVSSTDKKFEGKNFRSINSSNYLNIDSTVVNNVNDSLLIMVSPVMTFNSKLGALIINYAFQKPSLIGNP